MEYATIGWMILVISIIGMGVPIATLVFAILIFKKVEKIEKSIGRQ